MWREPRSYLKGLSARVSFVGAESEEMLFCGKSRSLVELKP